MNDDFRRGHDSPQVLQEKLRARQAARQDSRSRTGGWAAGTTRGAHDPQFSRWLAAQGWVGMTIPAEYGGRGSTARERLLITEEFLAVGAPLAAHWMAERQIAPSILRFGSETLKRRYLPPIARGESYFSVGFSEAEAGSDLAAVQTRAEATEGGWRLTGRKLWTSDALDNDYVEVLCRTSKEEDHHDGLSCLIVPLAATGVTVTPIEFLNGQCYYSEVLFEDVFVPEDDVVGEIGQGWQQVTAELAHERAGPERYMATYPLFEQFVDASRAQPTAGGAEVDAALGMLCAYYVGLREMALVAAEGMDGGAAPKLAAMLLKDLGTTFEQDLVEELRLVSLSQPALREHEPFAEALAAQVMKAPLYTLGGGSTEVLRTQVGKHLSRGVNELFSRARLGGRSEEAVLLYDSVLEVFDDLASQGPFGNGGGSDEALDRKVWDVLAQQGLLSFTWPDSSDAPPWELVLAVLTAVGWCGTAVPAVEALLTVPAMMRRCGFSVPPDAVVAFQPWAAPVSGRPLGAGHVELDGSLAAAWGRDATHVMGFCRIDDVLTGFILPASACVIGLGGNVAGEPRDDITLQHIRVSTDTLVPLDRASLESMQAAAALGRAALLAGSMARVSVLATEHATGRQQFGRPLSAFQSVRANIAMLAEAAECGRALVHSAFARASGLQPEPTSAMAAKVVTSRMAGQVARTGHQVLGAMGTTAEYSLNRFTRRLWAWREEDGSQIECARRLGASIRDGTPLALWEAITGVENP